MKKAYQIFFLGLLCLSFTMPAGASRFWATNVKEGSPQVLTEQLLRSPNSLKNLGQTQSESWTLAFYHGSAALIARTQDASKFDQAVEYAASSKAGLVIGQLGTNPSSCPVAAGDPIQRFYRGKSWLFSHGNGVSKELLIELIGPEYLRVNPPELCKDDPSASELYFIFLLKHIDEAGRADKGLRNALKELYAAATEGNPEGLNFYLTDGVNLWVFRNGKTIYYAFDKETKAAMVTTDVPGDQPFEWKEIPDDNLAIVKPSKKPKLVNLGK